MISLSDYFDIDVDDESSLSNFVSNPKAHHWKVGFKFESGHRDPTYGTNGKKYGSAKTFRQIYTALKKKGQDFIDAYFDDVYPYSDVKSQGDDLIANLNDEIGISVDTIITAKDEVFNIERKTDINYKRMVNARDRLNERQEILDSQQERFSTQLKMNQERIDSLNYEMSHLESIMKRNKDFSFDRRTKNYRLYMKDSSELSSLIEFGKSLKNYERESKRYENSLTRKQKAEAKLSSIKESSWKELNKKYENVAREFSESIKDDILSKARTGELPYQGIALAEETIKKRLSAGLAAYPRFWATGQLIDSIIVTCTLV